MAISSIHIEAGKMGFFGHNSRELLTKNAIFDDEENYFSSSSAKAIKLYKEETAKRSELYTQRMGRKLHSKTITHLSAIVNFNREHTPQDIEKVCDYLEEKFDTKVIQFAMHRDEGHITDDGEKIKNYHAHIEFLGLDSQGNSVRQKLDKKALINLQTDVANILDMQRGRNYTLEKTDRPKRLGTYEYKAHKKEEAKSIKAKQADLNQMIEELRKELIATKQAKAEDYAELRKAKAELASKDLTVEELKKEIADLKEIAFLKINNEEKSYKEATENALRMIEDLKAEISGLEARNKMYLGQNLELQKVIKDLKIKIRGLEESKTPNPTPTIDQAVSQAPEAPEKPQTIEENAKIKIRGLEENAKSLKMDDFMGFCEKTKDEQRKNAFKQLEQMKKNEIDFKQQSKQSKSNENQREL